MKITVTTLLTLMAGTTGALAQQPVLGGAVYGALGSGLAASAEIGLASPTRRVVGLRYFWSETHSNDVSAVGVFVAEKRSLLSVPVVLEAAGFASWQQVGNGIHWSPAISAGISIPLLDSGSLVVMLSLSGFVSTEISIPLLGIQSRFEFH